jgi:cytochrome c oxidase subunit 4
MTTDSQVAQHATHERPHPGPGEYIKIAVILAVVTALEVGAYYVTEIPRALFSILLLVMMTVKFSLVVLWFMHLRFDSRLFRRLFFVGVTLAILVYGVAFATLGLQRGTIHNILQAIRRIFGG